MSTSEIFALEKSGLNAFLFAEVGTETNGSELTVLSVLARLGQDPWDQAARWTKLPTAMIIDRLTQCITQMPLSEQALRDAEQTARRLIHLLPAQPALSVRTEFPTSYLQQLAGWGPVFLTTAILVMIIGVLLHSQIDPNVASPVQAAMVPTHSTAPPQ